MKIRNYIYFFIAFITFVPSILFCELPSKEEDILLKEAIESYTDSLKDADSQTLLDLLKIDNDIPIQKVIFYYLGHFLKEEKIYQQFILWLEESFAPIDSSYFQTRRKILIKTIQTNIKNLEEEKIKYLGDKILKLFEEEKDTFLCLLMLNILDDITEYIKEDLDQKNWIEKISHHIAQKLLSYPPKEIENLWIYSFKILKKRKKSMLYPLFNSMRYKYEIKNKTFEKRIIGEIYSVLIEENK